MPKYYSVKKIEISDKDRQTRYDDYLSEVKLGNLPSPTLTIEQYFDYDLLFEEVTMKCLECRFQDKFEHSHLHISMIANNTPFPLEMCPECGMISLMPLDIYRKIKGYKD